MVIGPSPKEYDGSDMNNSPDYAGGRCIGGEGRSPLGTDEAEMRSLYMLLTMDNDGGMEVMKYAARLRSDIFNSDPVQFALEVFLARKANNYVRFFALLKRASYITACVMFK